MSATVDSGTLITRSPEIREGRPRIAGTGVTVRRLVAWYKLGLSPEEISARIGHLTLAQVYAALAYYHSNREEIEADLEAEDEEADRLEEQHFGSQGHTALPSPADTTRRKFKQCLAQVYPRVESGLNKRNSLTFGE